MSEAYPTVIDCNRIMELLPHRYPILLVDRIIEFVEDDYLVGIKNVTFNEPHFQGHFPSKPIMPGVLLIEAMAQASGIFVIHSLHEDETKDRLVYFMSIENAKFRKPVVPGDTVHLKVAKQQSRGQVWKFKCDALVDGKRVAEATVTAMLVDKDA